jgi:hypothetical protein
MSEAFEAAVEIHLAVLEIARALGSEETRKERERYALLQAAATVINAGINYADELKKLPTQQEVARQAVDIAKMLLSEIYKREIPEAQS